MRSASSVTMNDLLHTYFGCRILVPDAPPRSAVEIRAVVLRLNHAWNMITLWPIQTYSVSNDSISDALQKVNWSSCLPKNFAHPPGAKRSNSTLPWGLSKPHLVQFLLETNWKFEVVEEFRVDFWSTMPPPNISHDTALSYSACSVGG